MSQQPTVKAQIKAVQKALEHAHDLAMVVIERMATDIMRKHNFDEFTLGMGDAVFYRGIERLNAEDVKPAAQLNKFIEDYDSSLDLSYVTFILPRR